MKSERVKREKWHPLTTALLRWFKQHGRELPWRATRDPYAIWLSEIILQQTLVRQGLPYWERFIRRWPTVEMLAAATEDEVLREWQGLGYYSRARNLHAAARQVVSMGGFPKTLQGLRSLKGVGDYTAAAIGSFAFGLSAAVVDGNVYRVLSRYFGISTPVNTAEGKKEFALLAQSLLPGSEYPEYSDKSVVADYNQALMDFGATQCTPQSPQCADCPLQDGCVALREGRVAQLPVKQKTLKVRNRRLTYIYIRWNGQTAIHRRHVGDIWAGLYEPLAMDRDQGTKDNGQSTICHIPYAMDNCRLLAKDVRHVLTHRVLYADFWLWEPQEQPPLPDGYFWIAEDDIDDYGVPRLVEILLEKVKL